MLEILPLISLMLSRHKQATTEDYTQMHIEIIEWWFKKIHLKESILFRVAFFI